MPHHMKHLRRIQVELELSFLSGSHLMDSLRDLWRFTLKLVITQLLVWKQNLIYFKAVGVLSLGGYDFEALINEHLTFGEEASPFNTTVGGYIKVVLNIASDDYVENNEVFDVKLITNDSSVVFCYNESSVTILNNDGIF